MQRQSVSGRAGETSGFTDKLVAKVLLRCWHVVSAPNGNAVKHFETWKTAGANPRAMKKARFPTTLT